ncbi:LacI family DNA-binding transcriptional regulator [Specibacter sp. NPDC057265]|uniref:LacI family DNA-binding transcriptional regulator n=1 Tax=Specibacter sp. NPDC057265 TaxID=3346075 RepID=UPI00363D0179
MSRGGPPPATPPGPAPGAVGGAVGGAGQAKVPGIREVAALSGLSVATVSRALGSTGSVSAQSRQRVQEAAAQLGFTLSYAASSLASGRHHNIGVVVPAVNRWYFSTLLDGLSAELIAAGYDLTLYTTGHGGEQRATVLSELLLRRRLDAVIAVALELTEAEVLQLLALNRPVLGVGGPLPGAHSIAIDEFAVAQAATHHLIGLGHSLIAYVGGRDEQTADFKLALRRRQGFESALQGAGLACPPEWLRVSDFTVQGAYATCRELLAGGRQRPTAIFAASDEMAFGAILAARDFGLRIPQDLSVIALDGHELGQLFGLTTFDQNPRGQGTLAAQRMLSRLAALAAGDGAAWEPVAEQFPAPLVVRSSTAVPPAT